MAANSDFPFAAGVAVITGAASGIGAALAAELAGRGAALALVDIDGPALERVAAGLRRRRRQGRRAPLRRRRSPRHRNAGGGGRRPRQSAHQQRRRGARRAVRAGLGGGFRLADGDQFRRRGADSPAPSCRACGRRGRRASSMSPAFSASSRRPGRPPTRPANSRCAAFPKRCAPSLPGRTSAFRSCIPAACSPTSPPTRAGRRCRRPNSPSRRGAGKKCCGCRRRRPPRSSQTESPSGVRASSSAPTRIDRCLQRLLPVSHPGVMRRLLDA